VSKFEEIPGNFGAKFGSRESGTSNALSPVDKGSLHLTPSRSEPFLFRDNSSTNQDKKPKSQSPVRGSSENKYYDGTHDYLILENVKLTKLVKKLEIKTQERKNNLKELFKLVNEKDNELNQLKTQAKIESSVYMVQVAEIFKLAEEKLKEKYLTLHKSLVQKETKLQNLESEISKICTHRGFTQASHRSIPTAGNLESQDLLLENKNDSLI